MSAFQNCTSVTPQCPIEASTYGYVPNLPANAILLTVFVLCTIFQISFGVYKRTWTFMSFVGLGCLMEFVGYIGRIQMHHNVWNESAFRTQIICLILAPSLIAGGIYLSLKHIILEVGPEHSRLKPKLYTWVFIGCDIVSILMQAAGGGIAAAGGTKNVSLTKTGNDVMIAGIAFQVATMAICAVFAFDFALRCFRRRSSPTALPIADREPTTPDIKDKLSEKVVEPKVFGFTRFQVFCVAEVFAYIVVFIRCIYRLPEMAGGWGNPLMRREPEFLLLDGMMIALAATTFVVFHPGFWFPAMGNVRKDGFPGLKPAGKEVQ